MNPPTLVVGAAVILILVAAAYFSFRSLKTGGCSECRRCERCGGTNCSIEDPEKKSK